MEKYSLFLAFRDENNKIHRKQIILAAIPLKGDLVDFEANIYEVKQIIHKQEMIQLVVEFVRAADQYYNPPKSNPISFI